MNILVTGGSGFIGTRLIDNLLKEGHSVKIYDKATSSKYPDLVTIGDVRDEKDLIEASKGIDIIYNLAAEHADDVTPLSLYADVNVGGAKNIVTVAKKNNIKRVVFTSTVAIYGLNKGASTEEMPAEPFNEYGKSKNDAETIFMQWANDNSENSLTVVRPAVVFGEENRGNVYNLISQVQTGKFLIIGDGQNKKSMGYVGNIAAFLAEQTGAPAGVRHFNFADKPDLTSREIIDIITDELDFKKKIPSAPYWLGLAGGYTFDIISKLTGKKFPISSIRIKKFTAETVVNTDKLIASGFKPPYTLEEGLRKMIAHEFKK